MSKVQYMNTFWKFGGVYTEKKKKTLYKISPNSSGTGNKGGGGGISCGDV